VAPSAALQFPDEDLAQPLAQFEQHGYVARPPLASGNTHDPAQLCTALRPVEVLMQLDELEQRAITAGCRPSLASAKIATVRQAWPEGRLTAPSGSSL
jgi:hypothetical protein